MKAQARFSAMPSLLVAALSLSGGLAQEPVPPAIRLFDLTTAHSIVREKPFQPASVFGPDEDAVYLWYAAEGCAIGTAIQSVWFYLETDPPYRWADASVVVDGPGAWGQFNFTLAPGRRWAIGRYRVELRVGGVLIAETYFSVTAMTEAQQ